MKRLLELISKCKGSVSIRCNAHRDGYQTIEAYLKDEEEMWGDKLPIKNLDEIIKRDILIEIRLYPRTTFGLCIIYHYDLEKAIDEALKSLEE